MWVARDKDGTLKCFTLVKPWRDYDCKENEQCWITDENTNTECILPVDLFPQFNNLTWDDEPEEVNLYSNKEINDMLKDSYKDGYDSGYDSCIENEF